MSRSSTIHVCDAEVKGVERDQMRYECERHGRRRRSRATMSEYRHDVDIDTESVHFEYDASILRHDDCQVLHNATNFSWYGRWVHVRSKPVRRYIVQEREQRAYAPVNDTYLESYEVPAWILRIDTRVCTLKFAGTCQSPPICFAHVTARNDEGEHQCNDDIDIAHHVHYR